MHHPTCKPKAGRRPPNSVSAQQLFQANYITISNTLSTYTRSYILSGGYKFILDEGAGIGLLTSTLIKSDFTSPITWDLNTKVTFADLWWAGISYRRKEAVSAMVGLHVAKNFNISYSYDYLTSELGRYSNGSHEFVLACQIFRLNDRFDPRVNWQEASAHNRT